MLETRTLLGFLLGITTIAGCSSSPVAPGTTPNTRAFLVPMLVPPSGASIEVRDCHGQTGYTYTCTERVSGTLDFVSSAGLGQLVNFRFLAANGMICAAAVGTLEEIGPGHFRAVLSGETELWPVFDEEELPTDKLSCPLPAITTTVQVIRFGPEIPLTTVASFPLTYTFERKVTK
jgi:hypothetical protein